MNFTEIKRLVKLVEKSEIGELEIQDEGFQIRIVKSVSGIQTVSVPPAFQQIPAPPPQPAVTMTQPESASDSASDHIVEIRSPMVGTFYRAPSPDADPYVKVGDEIQADTVLCIVEAMKLMNEIEAEISGKIVKIFVENAQAVEFNQPLFLVEKK